ncbi:MAG TPA: hypothetical protein VJX67_19375 [Blastocatellia bacterium]|nr:hypothetical protein [Blastocatellia bacterium]
MFTQLPDGHTLTLECKHCHISISIEETVAYHLVDGILYGWCQPCFSRRNQAGTEVAPPVIDPLHAEARA